MMLADWLKKTRTRQYIFARKIGVRDSVVSDYVNGRLQPSAETWERIVAATGGEVTPNDHLSDKAKRVIEGAREPAEAAP